MERDHDNRVGGGRSEPTQQAFLQHVALALTEFVTLEASDAGDGLEGSHESVYVHVDVEERDGRHELHLVTIPLAEVPASAALFRWVAVSANRFRFGALAVYVRDDGLVNLNLSHSVLVDGLDDEALRRTLLPVIYTAVDLRREAWSLFGELTEA